MSITKNVFRLNDVYDLINNSQWIQYDSSVDPGELWSWGTNLVGKLGDGTIIHRSSPIQIPGTQWNCIRANSATGLATKADGTLWTWGSNCRGVLGQGDLIHRSSPVQIPGTQWNAVGGNSFGGVYFSFARKTDGTLWAWGSNYTGTLGISAPGAGGMRSSPVQIPGTQWNDICAGSAMVHARKSDGTLWIWGADGAGAQGQNTSYVDNSSPIQIPGTQWSSSAAGTNVSLARKTDGTLWVWGCNANGQLGDNSRINRSSPIQIPGTQWNEVSAGGATSFARKTDGTLWTWGMGTGGQLGIDVITSRSSPVQIPGTLWNDVSAGGDHTFARKTDGTLWGWGQNYNPNAVLGNSTAITTSSPIQIPGTKWSQVSSACSQTLAIKLTS